MNAGHPSIPKLIEPAYQTNPRYWRIAFGNPECDSRWLVIDDDRLYFDRDGTGDLSETNNLICISDRISCNMGRFRIGDVLEKGQDSSHRKLVVFAEAGGAIDLRIILNWGPIQGASSIGSPDPITAPVVCFNGPLRLAPVKQQNDFMRLTRVEGDRIEIRATAIVGTASHCGQRMSFISHDPFSDEINPVAEIQFLNEAMSPVEEPLVLILSNRVCNCQFSASIDPQLIRTNRANVKLAFDRQLPIDVSPFTFQTELDLHTVVDDSCDL